MSLISNLLRNVTGGRRTGGTGTRNTTPRTGGGGGLGRLLGGLRGRGRRL